MGYINFVRCQLATSITSTATSITLSSNTSPFNLPPTDGGTLVLADSINKPSKLEIITYTGMSGLTLNGVVRGAEGTTAQAWPSSSYCYMSFTALMLTSFKADMAAALQTVINKQDKHANLTALSGITSGTGLFKRDSSGAWVLDTTQYSTVTLASATPLAGSASGSVGTSLKAAKEDHTHPLQTSISGNAGTATKLASPISFTFTGGATGSLSSFDGSSNVTINLTVDAGSHTHGLASASANGLMSSAQFTKLTGIADNANNYVHPTGAGNSHIPASGTNVNRFLKSGTNDTYSWSLLSKTDVGLSNVDNTSDANKPLSTAMVNALLVKLNTSAVGVAGGVAGLDANALVPSNQLPLASSAVSGVVKLPTDTVNSVTANSASSTANRTYQIQRNTNGGLVVNIPWTDTVYTHPTSGVTTGSYTKVTVDNNGHVISGSNPTTVQSYGITNAVRSGVTSTGSLTDTGNAIYLGWNGTHLVLSVDSTFYSSTWPISISGAAPWSGISGKPTSLSGYGITDATPSSHIGSTGSSHGVATTSANGFMSTTQVASLNSVTGTGVGLLYKSSTSDVVTYSSAQIASLTTTGLTVSSITTNGLINLALDSGLDSFAGFSDNSANVGIVKLSAVNSFAKATSTDILALVPDATVSQSGKMTTSQVSSLDELAGLVSMGSGVVKKTLNTSSIDTYSMATIADLVTSTNAVTNLNADMLDGKNSIDFFKSTRATGETREFEAKVESGGYLRIGVYESGAWQNHLDLKDDSFYRKGYKIWDAGNGGTNSGLDADMLDGNHASAFALSGHTHGIATTSTAGFLSTADAAKLNALTVSRLLQVTTVGDPPVDEVHDLNNFITNGFFHHRLTSYAKDGLNYPAPYAGMLDVKVSDFMVYQWYHTYNNKGVYFRSKYISTWYPWCKVFDSVNTTSADILALVPDATTLQSGKMTTSQVTSLNELGGLVSMGSGVVKKTFSTSGIDTYTTAAISDLVTSTNVVTNLNADMLDGNHASAFALSGHVHSEEASVTLTSSGLTTETTATAKLTKNGDLVSIDVPTLTGAGTETTFKLTGIPTQFRPASTKEFLVRGNVAGVLSICRATINTSGELQVYSDLNTGTFSTTSNTRGVNKISLTYQIH